MSDIKIAEIVECISVCYCRSQCNLGCHNCQFNIETSRPNCEDFMYQFHLLPKEKREKICINNFIPFNFWG